CPSPRRRVSHSPRPALLLLTFNERFEQASARRMPKLSESFGFDLAYAFARYGEVFADLFERVLFAESAEAEAHLDDLLLARAERCQHLIRYLAQVRCDNRFGGAAA